MNIIKWKCFHTIDTCISRCFTKEWFYRTPQIHCSDNNRENNIEEKKWCKRKIIWFNPPYSMNVRTNIGKTFLKLMEKHFPNGNPLHKIFNKNTLKVSYSCMGNMASIISSRNHTILNLDVSLEYGCNGRSRTNFHCKISVWLQRLSTMPMLKWHKWWKEILFWGFWNTFQGAFQKSQKRV